MGSEMAQGCRPTPPETTGASVISQNPCAPACKKLDSETRTFYTDYGLDQSI